MTDIRFAFERLQHDHDAKTFGFATEGPSLTRQEFAEECDINVLMAYGRCLRPALYSSLCSSPSHPSGVSALRVTIAIASARKQWGLRELAAKSRRLFGEPATGRPRRQDGEIKEARRSNSKPLTWLGFFRAGRSWRVPRLAF